MEKEYNKNPEKNKVEEPALEYQTNSPVSPCQHTPKELQERVLTATKHVEEGKYYTDKELDDFVLS